MSSAKMFQAINDEDINALKEILKEQSSQLHNARTVNMLTIPLRSDLELDIRNYPNESSEMNFFSSCLHIHNFWTIFLNDLY